MTMCNMIEAPWYCYQSLHGIQSSWKLKLKDRCPSSSRFSRRSLLPLSLALRHPFFQPSLSRPCCRMQTAQRKAHLSPRPSLRSETIPDGLVDSGERMSTCLLAHSRRHLVHLHSATAQRAAVPWPLCVPPLKLHTLRLHTLHTCQLTHRWAVRIVWRRLGFVRRPRLHVEPNRVCRVQTTKSSE